MAANQENNSYQEYKKNLESSIGYEPIPRPPRLMSAYNAFCFERKLLEKLKSKTNKIDLNKSIKSEWESLNESKKQFYIRIYEIRKKQYDKLKQQYIFLNSKVRSINSYICYFKQKYPLLLHSYSDVNHQMITKMIAADWKNLDTQSKFLYQKLADDENYKTIQAKQQKQQAIKEYQQKILLFKQLLYQDKLKIIAKFKKISTKFYRQKQIQKANAKFNKRISKQRILRPNKSNLGKYKKLVIKQKQLTQKKVNITKQNRSFNQKISQTGKRMKVRQNTKQIKPLQNMIRRNKRKVIDQLQKTKIIYKSFLNNKTYQKIDLAKNNKRMKEKPYLQRSPKKQQK